MIFQAHASKFESVKECPKCGKSVYLSTGEYNCLREYIKETKDMPEHFNIVCCGCAFTWKEHCKDK